LLNKKYPKKKLFGQNKQKMEEIFFHPDFTVGTGITPVQLSLADYDISTSPPVGNYTLP